MLAVIVSMLAAFSRNNNSNIACAPRCNVLFCQNLPVCLFFLVDLVDCREILLRTLISELRSPRPEVFALAAPDVEEEGVGLLDTKEENSGLLYTTINSVLQVVYMDIKLST